MASSATTTSVTSRLDADVNITIVPGFVVTPGVGYKHFDAMLKTISGAAISAHSSPSDRLI